MMRVALTGATGFVGRRILDKLLSAGHDVVALARKPESIKAHQNCRVIAGDLSNSNALREFTANADVVLHVAGVVSAPTRDGFFNTNVEGTRALAAAAKANGAKRFVFVSSLAAREPTLNNYAASKAAAEPVMQAFADAFELTILRPSAVYGPGDVATLPLLKILLSKVALIPGAPQARFGMVHVEDVAQTLLETLSGPTGIFELDDGDGGHTWIELLKLTRDNFGTPSHYAFIPRPVAMSIGAIGSAWGRLRNKVAQVNAGQLSQLYHPDWIVRGEPWPLSTRISLASGLPDTIRWYQDNGLLPQRGTADREAVNGKTL